MNYIQITIKENEIKSIYTFFEKQNKSIENTNNSQTTIYYDNKGQEIQETNYNYFTSDKIDVFTEYYNNGLIKYQYKITNDIFKEDTIISEEILLPDKSCMYEIKYLYSQNTERYFKCRDGWMFETFYDDDENKITRTYTDKNFKILKSETYDCKKNKIIENYERFVNDKNQCYKTISREYEYNDCNKQINTTTQEFKYDKNGNNTETDFTYITENKQGKCLSYNNVKYIREYRDDGLPKTLIISDKNNGVIIEKYEYIILE